MIKLKLNQAEHENQFPKKIEVNKLPNYFFREKKANKQVIDRYKHGAGCLKGAKRLTQNK